jgi:hypothetical protein
MTRARNTADTQTASGGPVSPSIAGKNKIINGDFYWNQRNFSSSTTTGTYGFDRFYFEFYGGSSTTYSAQTFTAGAAPVAGYEAKNYARLVTAGQANSADYAALAQRIEGVRTLANQTVTVSFWAKASTGTPNIQPSFGQVFGTGGSSTVLILGSVSTLSTTWTRYSTTVSIPSISGKTIGTNDELRLWLFTSAGSGMSSYSTVGLQNVTIDIWGVQVEAGSVVTPFQTATGTIQGELAACQRYYYRRTGTGGPLTFGMAPNSTTVAQTYFQHPVTMRTAPSAIEVSGVGCTDEQTSYTTGTTTWDGSDTQATYVRYTHGSAALTAYRAYKLYNTGANSYLAVSAEL